VVVLVAAMVVLWSGGVMVCSWQLGGRLRDEHLHLAIISRPSDTVCNWRLVDTREAYIYIWNWSLLNYLFTYDFSSLRHCFAFSSAGRKFFLGEFKERLVLK